MNKYCKPHLNSANPTDKNLQIYNGTIALLPNSSFGNRNIEVDMFTSIGIRKTRWYRNKYISINNIEAHDLIYEVLSKSIKNEIIIH